MDRERIKILGIPVGWRSKLSAEEVKCVDACIGFGRAGDKLQRNPDGTATLINVLGTRMPVEELLIEGLGEFGI